jgi:hypothetical protein
MENKKEEERSKTTKGPYSKKELTRIFQRMRSFKKLICPGDI